MVDAETYEVEKYLLVGQRVWQLAFTPDEKTLISTNGVSNDITFIDVATDEPVKSVTGGRAALGRGRVAELRTKHPQHGRRNMRKYRAIAFAALIGAPLTLVQPWRRRR